MVRGGELGHHVERHSWPSLMRSGPSDIHAPRTLYSSPASSFRLGCGSRCSRRLRMSSGERMFWWSLALVCLGLADSAVAGDTSADRLRIAFPDDRLAVHGLPWFAEDAPALRRLPMRLQSELRPPVWSLAQHPSGGRIRFRTDSTTVGLVAENPAFSNMHHMASVGENGFDLYVNGGSIWAVPGPTPKARLPGNGALEPSRTLRDVTLYLPLYKPVRIMEISLDSNAVCGPAILYGLAAPSSTTNPSTTMAVRTHLRILARPPAERDERGFRHFGVSATALGDPPVAEAITGLEPSCVVLDSSGQSVARPVCRCAAGLRRHPAPEVAARSDPGDRPVLLCRRVI